MSPESDQLSQDIREIKWHQEAIDSAMEHLIRGNKGPILAEIMSFFGTSKRRAEVYLAVDGEKTVSEIARQLGMKGPNVSTDVSLLKDYGLIQVKGVSGSGVVYKKHRIGKIVGLSKELERKFALRAPAGEKAEAAQEESAG